MKNLFLQEIPLTFGEITEKVFFSIRNTISNTLKILKIEIENLSDNPNLPLKEFSQTLKETSDLIEKIQNFSNESLLSLLYYFSEFIGKFFELIRPFEPYLYQSLYEDIQLETLFSNYIFQNENYNHKNIIFHKNIQLNLDIIKNQITEEYYKKIIILFPPVISDEFLWENSIERYIQNNYILIKLRINPFDPLNENINKIYEILKLINQNPLQKKYLMGFGSGNLLIHYLLNQYHTDLDDSFQIIFINSPEFGIKIERFLLWAGIAFQYYPKESFLLFKILMNPQLQTLNSLSYNKIEILKNKNQLQYLKKYNIYKIYSLISENNTLWKNWIGDGFSEESSLCYLDSLINEEQIFILSGVSYLQVLKSYGFRYILSKILNLANY